MPRKSPGKSVANEKVKALEAARENGVDQALTTNHGTRINDNQNSLKAGARGPSRFSTVAGSRGSSDLARDARGFAVKFYTEEGNFDSSRMR